MLFKTKGIVLHSFPYNDKYKIVTIYTKDFGRIAYLAANTRSKKTKIPHSLLQPLSMIDLEVEHQNTREIQRIKEAKSCFIQTQLHFNPVKNAISLFISEVLYRIIQEKEANHTLFDFLSRSIKWLEITDSGAANFCIHIFTVFFLLQAKV